MLAAHVLLLPLSLPSSSLFVLLGSISGTLKRLWLPFTDFVFAHCSSWNRPQISCMATSSLRGHHSLHHTAIAQIICGIILTVYYWGTFSLLVVEHRCCYSLESQAMLCQRYAQYGQRTRDPKWNDCIRENEAKSYWGQLRDQITSGEREREGSRRITAMRCSDFR